MMFKVPSPLLSYTSPDLSPDSCTLCTPPGCHSDWKGDTPELNAGSLVWIRTLDHSPSHSMLWVLPTYRYCTESHWVPDSST